MSWCCEMCTDDWCCICEGECVRTGPIEEDEGAE